MTRALGAKPTLLAHSALARPGAFGYIFYNNSPEETMHAISNSPAPWSWPTPKCDPLRSAWLLCYPILEHALANGETHFGALPPYAKLPVLKRTGGALSTSSAILNDVRVAYVELITANVVEAVERYFSSGTRSEAFAPPTTLDVVAEQFAPTVVPLVARPPCLLSPGKGVFLDGWTQFFAYWSRNDKTIPLLAVDWPTLYERLPAM